MIDRKRVTERVSPAVVKLELKRALGPLAVIAVGLVFALAAAYYIVSNINGGVSGTRTMRVEVANATGVVPDRAEVRFLGIHAGVITGAQLVHGGAVLTFNVAKSFGPVYRNATIVLRPNTPLEDMYLDITSRGTPSAGVVPANYTIPQDQTQSPVNLSSVLNLFQPDVRAQLNNLLNDFGNGLADRGASLRQAFYELAPLLNIAGNVSGQLAERASLTKQLVHNAAILTQTLGSRSTQLHTFVTQWTTALTHITAQNGVPLKSAIAEFPTFLSSATGLLGTVLAVDPTLNTAITSLKPVARELPAGLAHLRQLAVSAKPAVVKLQQPVQKLVPLAKQLQPFSSDLNTALKNIQPQIGDFNTTAQAAADCTVEAAEFFNWDAAIGPYSDDAGQFVQGNFNFGFYSVPGVQDSEYTYRKPCAGGDSTAPELNTPTPKLNGPAVAP